MPAIEIAAELGDDFDRILAHRDQHEVAATQARVREMVEAIDILATNPRIGAPAARDLRALIIGRGARGYVALYRYAPEVDVVFVLAIRSQREAGYTQD